MGNFRLMSIRDDVRPKEEIFKSDYVTWGEMAVYFKTPDEMYNQQNEYRRIVLGIEDDIKDRWEILDL